MRGIVTAGVAVAAIALVAACGGANGSKEPGSGYGAGPHDRSASPRAEDRAGSVANGDLGRPAKASAPVLQSAKIRTADLTVDVTGARNVAVKADAAADIAVRAGGEVDGDERASGKHATATLRLQVPPRALPGSLQALSSLGTAKSRHVGTRDVTQQVADVRSRTASAAQAIARLRTLYRSATEVADVIAIEGELSQREADLESLQAQQRTLAAQTSLASITLYLRTAAVASPAEHHDRTGFVGGLEKGWDAFASAAGAVATAAGAVVPFVVLALLLGVALRLLWPRLVPRRRTTPAPAAPSE